MENTKAPYLTFIQKIFVIVAVLTATFLYSSYEKSKYDQFVNKAPSLILKEMPEFTAVDVDTDQPISRESFARANKAVMVHFWGTWCAPCEAELPSFMKFAKKMEDKNITVFILAVNDELKAVKKYLKRYSKDRPKNVLFGIDKEGVTLPLYGSVKVPETYLFSNKLRHLEKFVGPQDWEHRSYFDRVLKLVEATNLDKMKNVESH
ncbi:MAG: thiol-disulfide isomerase/thioredoxin [Bacteriovoracaceae bacterium]|jgi:thiol-disulfide isomerase/thioredoxin